MPWTLPSLDRVFFASPDAYLRSVKRVNDDLYPRLHVARLCRAMSGTPYLEAPVSPVPRF